VHVYSSDNSKWKQISKNTEDENKQLKQQLKAANEKTQELEQHVYELRSVERKMKWQSTGVVQVNSWDVGLINGSEGLW